MNKSNSDLATSAPCLDFEILGEHVIVSTAPTNGIFADCPKIPVNSIFQFYQI